jgi:nicotinamidase-related amidase
VHSIEPSRTALVLIDLMYRIVDQPLAPRPGTDVVQTATRLAARFREMDGQVVIVRVERPGVQTQPPGSEIVDGLREEADILVTKRSINAFHDTDLDDQLRARHIGLLVLAGIATNLGVESTGRAASDHGYELIFIEDAMTALSAEEHHAAVTLDLPRFGDVMTSAELEERLLTP